jgi:hypothetical protein
MSEPKLIVEGWCSCGVSCFAPVPVDSPRNNLMIDNALRKHGWTKVKISGCEDIWQCKKCSNQISTRGVPNVGSTGTRES